MNIIKSKTKLRKLTLVFSMLFCLNGCRSVELKTLESAASTIQPTMGHEVYRHTQDEGTTLGKPDYPEIVVRYEPIGNYTKEDLYNEIIKIFKQNGWQTEELMTDPFDYFIASLPQENFELLVTVSIDSRTTVVNVTFETLSR